MNKIKNLQLVHSFSQYSSRVIKVSESLINECNFEVTILPADQSDIDKQDVCSEGLTVNRIRLWASKLPKNFVTQLLKYVEYSYKVTRFSKQEKFDLITVRKYTFLPIGFTVAKILNIPLIYDVHELEALQSGQSWSQKLTAKMFERLFIKQCSAVITVSPSISDWYKKTYGLKHVSTVMNCPKAESIIDNKETNKKKLRQEFGLSNKTKLLIYVGGLFEERNLPSILNLMEMPKMKEFAVIFMGYGPFASQIKKHKLYKKNIFLKEAVAQQDVVSAISGADISIMLPVKNDSLSHEFSLPNKFFQSIMAIVPFVSTDLPTVASVIERHEIGYTVSKHDDYDALQFYILKLIQNEKMVKKNLIKASKIFNWEKEETTLIKAYLASVEKRLPI